jgi:hypothetical protein
MTPEQKSKQASQNANASRIKWQRQAIVAGGLARANREVAESAFRQVAELQARVKDIAAQLVASLDKRVADRKEIETLRAACQQAENEADLWRSMLHEAQDMDVQRKARDMAKGGAA